MIFTDSPSLRKTLSLLAVSMLLSGVSAGLRAETDPIPLSELGDLKVGFAAVQALAEIPGSALRGEVRFRAGEAFSVMLPMAAQRVEFLLPAGADVDIGDGIARLRGPDVHHWLLSSAAIATRFAAAQTRFEQNHPLFEAGALSAAAWADIQREYFDLQLENEHREHVLELALESEGGTVPVRGDTITLGAPIPGFADFDTRRAQRAVDEMLFRIIPEAALRLQVDVPRRRAQDLVALRLGDCRVGLAQTEASNDGFFTAVWSDGLSGSCYRPPGSVESVTPYYRREAMAVPRSAIFQWQQSAHVLVRDDDALRPVAVELIGDADGRSLVAPGTLREGQAVLTESVSAVQGVLLGLGADE